MVVALLLSVVFVLVPVLVFVLVELLVSAASSSSAIVAVAAVDSSTSELSLVVVVVVLADDDACDVLSPRIADMINRAVMPKPSATLVAKTTSLLFLPEVERETLANDSL